MASYREASTVWRVFDLVDGLVEYLLVVSKAHSLAFVVEGAENDNTQCASLATDGEVRSIRAEGAAPALVLYVHLLEHSSIFCIPDKNHAALRRRCEDLSARVWVPVARI